MKRIVLIALLLCAFVVFLTGCASQSASGQSDVLETESAKIANPIKEYDSLAAAEKAAGFPFTVPEGVEVDDTEYAQYYWSTIDKSLIEVRYGEDGDEVCYMRKAAKSADMEDISGDYNVYDDVKKVDIELEDGRESTVTLKGKDGEYYLAVWDLKGTEDNGVWSYAIGTKGMWEEELLNLVKMVE